MFGVSEEGVDLGVGGVVVGEAVVFSEGQVVVPGQEVPLVGAVGIVCFAGVAVHVPVFLDAIHFLDEDGCGLVIEEGGDVEVVEEVVLPGGEVCLVNGGAERLEVGVVGVVGVFLFEDAGIEEAVVSAVVGVGRLIEGSIVVKVVAIPIARRGFFDENASTEVAAVLLDSHHEGDGGRRPGIAVGIEREDWAYPGIVNGIAPGIGAFFVEVDFRNAFLVGVPAEVISAVELDFGSAGGRTASGAEEDVVVEFAVVPE